MHKRKLLFKETGVKSFIWLSFWKLTSKSFNNKTLLSFTINNKVNEDFSVSCCWIGPDLP